MKPKTDVPSPSIAPSISPAWWLLVPVLLLAAFAIARFLPQGDQATVDTAVAEHPFVGQPVHYRRDASGSLAPRESGLPAIPEPGNHAGRIEANNSMSSSSSTSSSSHWTFAARRILILNESSDELMERVGWLLPQELAELPFVEEVAYYPHGSSPPEGFEAPDVYIRLDATNLDITGGFAKQEVEGQIHVYCGSSPLDSGTYEITNRTLPVVQFHYSGHLRHRSETTGIGGNEYRLAMVTGNLVEQIATSLRKYLGEFEEKHDLLPELGPAFQAEYRPIPSELDFQSIGAQKWLSTHGLLRHNETIWIVPGKKIEDVVQELQSRLAELGWEVETDDNQSSLKASHEHRTVRVMQTKSEVQHTLAGDGPAAEVYLVYTEPMTDAEAEAAVQNLLDGNKSVDAAVMFFDFLSATQQQQLKELLAEGPLRSVGAALTLARMHERASEREPAIAALQAAYALDRVTPEFDSLSSIKSLADELKLDEQWKKQLPESVFKRLGWVQLDPERLRADGRPGDSDTGLEQVAGLNEPAVFYRLRDDGSWQAVAMSLERQGQPVVAPVHYRLTHAVVDDQMSSWGTSTGNSGDTPQVFVTNLEGLGRVSFQLTLEDQQVRVVAKSSEEKTEE